MEEAIVIAVTVQQAGHTEVKHFRLRPGKEQAIKIGKAPGSDIQVKNPACSTQHAEIRLKVATDAPPQLILRDLSVNGTGLQRSGSTKTKSVEKEADTVLEDEFLIFMPYRLKVKSADPEQRIWLRVTKQKIKSSAELKAPPPPKAKLSAFPKKRANPPGVVAQAEEGAQAASSSQQATKPAIRATCPKLHAGPLGKMRPKEEAGPARDEEGRPSYAKPTLMPGMRVVLTGLRGATELNGTGGKITEFDEEVGRWNVILDGAGGDIKAIKAAHLLPAPQEAEETLARAAAAESAPSAPASPALREEQPNQNGADKREPLEAPVQTKAPSKSRSRSRSSRKRSPQESPSPLQRRNPRAAASSVQESRVQESRIEGESRPAGPKQDSAGDGPAPWRSLARGADQARPGGGGGNHEWVSGKGRRGGSWSWGGRW